ncbi:mitochondrial carrier domain-containing protein [Fimicolochytrium jonesii]|uniref:mitochondrial carrier domain-containing protein n=1 Tax=Fimicolochytrium jonesii TaxID=1396493 RepID=UPI0022FDF6F4|nr:mitochondrial carrier domain-containing protein [Fimicolochytrium jonesii]KAI8818299.1 mitochondrial carrier domain-containing protein [Fimicolochytrium jonesii]
MHVAPAGRAAFDYQHHTPSLIKTPPITHRVRLQSQHETGKRYRGTVHCMTSIVREERFRGLYKGMASPLVGVAVINSLLFGVYGYFLRHIGSGEDSILSIAAAGSASGFINAFFSCPMELVKIRLQNQRDAPPTASGAPGIPMYKGPVDCMQQIYRQAGIRGYFRGLGCTIIRETPSYGAYFATYELLSRALIPANTPPQSEPSLKLLLAGGLAGVCAWLSTYPFDVVKTRLQSAENESKKTYTSTFQCLRTIVRAEGPSVLFSGWAATAVRAFPTNAATFYAVGWAKVLLAGAFGAGVGAGVGVGA